MMTASACKARPRSSPLPRKASKVQSAPADMAEFDARDVVGNGARLLRDGQHAIGWPVQELRFLFDEAGDQSRASAAVDLGPFAGGVPPRKGCSANC
jgi:hypothetical protein